MPQGRDRRWPKASGWYGQARQRLLCTKLRCWSWYYHHLEQLQEGRWKACSEAIYSSLQQCRLPKMLEGRDCRWPEASSRYGQAWQGLLRTKLRSWPWHHHHTKQLQESWWKACSEIINPSMQLSWLPKMLEGRDCCRPKAPSWHGQAWQRLLCAKLWCRPWHHHHLEQLQEGRWKTRTIRKIINPSLQQWQRM